MQHDKLGYKKTWETNLELGGGGDISPQDKQENTTLYQLHEDLNMKALIWRNLLSYPHRNCMQNYGKRVMQKLKYRTS